jgi:hypothetical protein
MNMLSREFFALKRMMKRLRQKHKGTNLHHREAVKNGGTDKAGNLIRVNKKTHAAYHALFGTKTPLQIVQDLNRRWLPLRVTLVLVPTGRLTEVLALLAERNVVESTEPACLGVTSEHLRFHGTPEEQHTYAELRSAEK